MQLSWQIASILMLFVTLFSSLRLAITKKLSFIEDSCIHFFSLPHYSVFIIIFLPWAVGDFSRSESSPFPWEAFSIASSRHGFFDGLYFATMVFIADLWLFWIPANIYVIQNSNAGRVKHNMARIINVLSGLILCTPNNPIYAAINWICFGRGS